MHRSIRFLVVAAVATASFCAGAEPAPLTLPEAQRLALARSRQLSAQDSVIAASREMAVAAGRLPDATAKIEVQNLPVDGMDAWSFTADSMTMRSFGLMQEWTRGEKRELRRERYEREADRAAADKDAAAASIARDTALAWLDRYYADALVIVAREELDAAQLEITAADSAYRAGRVNQYDVLAAHSARVGLEDRLSELERKARNAATVLARWTGAGADTPLSGKPAIDRIPYDAAQLEAQVARHPAIAALERQQDVAATDARLARAESKIDPTFEVMYGKRASMYGDMITFSVSIPLQWSRSNRQDREIAAKAALAEAARAETEENSRSILAELATMAAEWRNGLERLVRFERELVPLARERTRAALAAYQGAKATSGDLLLARRNEIDVRMQALQLESDTARLWAALTYLAPGAVGGSSAMSSSPSTASMGSRSMGASKPMAPASPAPSSGTSTMTPSKM